MRITWWLYPGIHETARMRLDSNNGPVVVEDRGAPTLPLTGYDHEFAGSASALTSGPLSPPSAFVLL